MTGRTVCGPGAVCITLTGPSEEKPAELESNWAAAGGCLSVFDEDVPGRQHKAH